MMQGLKDWRTTVAGIVIAGVIGVALYTRPQWGVAEIATLVGAVCTALLGAFSKFHDEEEK